MVSAADVERLFLQAVLSRGVMSGDLARVLWEKSVEAVNAVDESLTIPIMKDRESWDNFVTQVNHSLDKYDLDFKVLHDETSGKDFYALLNRKGDEIAQMATDYNPAEIAFFKAVVEQIMLAPKESFSVSSLAALREVSTTKSNMSKTHAENVLSSFVAKGWLLKSKRGRYSLTTRALLELLPYLKSTYPDEIIECTICFEIITRGVRCHTTNCKSRLHYHCFTSYRRRSNACPSCSKDWPREPRDKPLLSVGEDAVKDGEDGKRRIRVASVEQSDSEEGDEDEPATQTQSSSAPKKTRQQKSKPREDDIDVVDGEEEAPPPTNRSLRTRRSKRR